MPPPHNIEAEQAALGAAIIDRDAPLPPPSNFYREAHQHVASAIHALRATGGADILLVWNWLRERGHANAISAAELDALTTAGSAAHAAHYARIVMERAAERRCREAMRRFVNDNDSGRPLSALLPDLMRTLSAENVGERKPTSMQDALTDLAADIESGRHAERLYLGLGNLDEMLEGVRTRQVVAIAGAPGMGKSAFALQCAVHIASNYGPVALVSLEMRRDEVAERVAAQWTKQRVRSVTKDAAAVRRVANELGGAVCQVYDWRMGLDDWAAHMRQFKATHPNMSAFVLDYVQLMSRDAARSESKEFEFLQEAMPLAKGLAGELNCVGFVLAQLKGEARTAGVEPTGESIRGPAILENSDKAVVLWASDGTYFAKVVKNRQGPTGNVELGFNKESVTFTAPGQRPTSPPRSIRRNAPRYETGVAFEDVPL